MFRFDVGFDYPTYWKSIYPHLDKIEVNRWEIIPRYLGLFCNKYHCPSLFFILTSIVTYLFVFFSIKENSKSYYESIIIYVTLFFLESMGIVREAMAVSITFWGSRYIFSKKLMKYLLCCLLAFLCHQSALIAIPIYFIYHYLDIKKSLLFVVVLVLLKGFVFSKLNELNLMLSYLNRLDELKGGNTVKYFYLFLTVYLFVMTKLLGSYNQCKKLLPIIIISNLFPIFFGGHMGLRFSVYYNMYIVFCWPLVFDKMKIKYRALNLVILYLFFIMFIGISIRNPSRSAYVPYQTIFFADKENFRFN
jgi:hypothetical protein